MSSPTARTLKYLRDEGWEAQVVERWCQFSRRRKDLFNFIDVVAIKHGRIMGVQATSGSNHAGHKAKILAEERALGWLKAGGSIMLITWSKRKLKPGGKAVRWTPRIEMIEEGMFDEDREV